MEEQSLNNMERYHNGINIEKNDIITVKRMEGNKPEITIKDKEDDFFLKFEDAESFEYFALKMDRIRKSYKNPRLVDRIDTARMKTILLNKAMNRIKIRE